MSEYIVNCHYCDKKIRIFESETEEFGYWCCSDCLNEDHNDGINWVEINE